MCMKYEFNVAVVTQNVIHWIKKWFDNNGKDCKAIIGISGGKDSSVVAALCVAALGKERVMGVLMPKGVQTDIKYAYQLVDYLQISYTEINISDAYQRLIENIIDYYSPSKKDYLFIDISDQTKINLPARLRMATLYAVSQSMNGRVANTCNLSEDWIGYSTRYGDSVGDFSPLADFTASEVIEIGQYLGLPDSLVFKPPSDGLCGKTDEDNIGFTYEILDKYIRTGAIEDCETKKKIDEMHKKNLFKQFPMASYYYGLPNVPTVWSF